EVRDGALRIEHAQAARGEDEIVSEAAHERALRSHDAARLEHAGAPEPPGDVRRLRVDAPERTAAEETPHPRRLEAVHVPLEPPLDEIDRRELGEDRRGRRNADDRLEGGGGGRLPPYAPREGGGGSRARRADVPSPPHRGAPPA